MFAKIRFWLVTVAIIYLAYLFFESQVEGGAGGNNPVLMIGAGLFLLWGMTRGGDPFKKREQPVQEPNIFQKFFKTIFSMIAGFGLLLVFAWAIDKF